MIPFDRQPLRRRPPPRGDVFSPPSPTALLPLPTTTAPAVCPDPSRVEVLAVSCDSRPHFDRHLVVPADRTQTMRFRLRSSWAVRVRTKKAPVRGLLPSRRRCVCVRYRNEVDSDWSRLRWLSFCAERVRLGTVLFSTRRRTTAARLDGGATTFHGTEHTRTRSA